jgi:carboxyl-terminal processing protease
MRRKFAAMAAVIILIGAFIGVANAQQLSEPEKNFEQLWKTYDRNYALFGPKRIDWDLLYKVYRPRVTPRTTDKELFDVMSSLLGNLNDNHVRLTSPERSFQSGILGQLKMEDFSVDLVKEKYLKGHYTELMNNVFQYGWLGDSIGYFHFRNFSRIEESTAAIDQIVKEFKDAKGIIIDVRANGGGDDLVGKLIADRFADRKRLYMKTCIRNGPDHSNFSPWKYWYVEPEGGIQFTKPVILLTHRFSVSAAENFTLAMRVLPNVTVVGDATSGVFADVYGDALPNGWRFSVPFKLFIDQEGFCWEGIGVPANIRQINTKDDIEAKQDKVLELAISLINTGALRLHNQNAGLNDVRESLARNLAKGIEDRGLDAALAGFEKAKAGRSDSYYLDEHELADAGEGLMKKGKPKEAIQVFNLLTREFPGSYQTYEHLGGAYLSAGDDLEARAAYKKSVELNPQSYPWDITAYQTDAKLAAGVHLLARNLSRDIDAKGIEPALKMFDDAKTAAPSTYYIDESEINVLGYQLLGQGKVKESIEVFKLNVREFPNSFNVYDSLGEAYLKAGNKELAVANYKKSIELNPKNANGIDALRKIEQPRAGVKIDPAIYDAYAGQYEGGFGVVTITREGDKLFAQPTGQSREELIPQSETRFTVASVGAEVFFVKDDKGQVSGVTVILSGQQLQGKKVK